MVNKYNKKLFVVRYLNALQFCLKYRKNCLNKVSLNESNLLYHLRYNMIK